MSQRMTLSLRNSTMLVNNYNPQYTNASNIYLTKHINDLDGPKKDDSLPYQIKYPQLITTHYAKSLSKNTNPSSQRNYADSQECIHQNYNIFVKYLENISIEMSCKQLMLHNHKISNQLHHAVHLTSIMILIYLGSDRSTINSLQNQCTPCNRIHYKQPHSHGNLETVYHYYNSKNQKKSDNILKANILNNEKEIYRHIQKASEKASTSKSNSKATQQHNDEEQDKQNNNNGDRNNGNDENTANNSGSAGDGGDDKRDRNNGDKHNEMKVNDQDEDEQNKRKKKKHLKQEKHSISPRENQLGDNEKQNMLIDSEQQSHDKQININTSEHDEKMKELQENSEEKHWKSLNPNANTFETNRRMVSHLDTIDEIKEEKEEKEDVIGPGKVKIPRKFTETVIPQIINEKIIKNNIYPFMNKCLIFPQIRKLFENNNNSMYIINFGFHDKKLNPLYCVILKLPNHKKYKWIMKDKLFTSIEIETTFQIGSKHLPESIQMTNDLKSQITFSNDISKTMHNIINKTKWHSIPIHCRKNKNERRTLSLSITEFRNKITNFYDINVVNINNLIKIVRMTNNKYWFEYVWIVKILNNVTIGISLQLNKNKIQVKGIHLQKQLIYESHILSGYHNCHCLDTFVSFYDDIQIGDVDKHKNMQKQLKRELTQYKTKYLLLKEFIEKQMNSSNDIELAHAANKLLESITTPILDHNIIAQEQQTDNKSDNKSTESDTNLHFQFQNDPNMNIPMPTSIIQSHSQESQITITNALQLPPLPYIPPPPPMLLPVVNPLLNYPLVSSPMVQYQKFMPKSRKNCVFISKSLTNKYRLEIQMAFKDIKILFYYLNNTIHMQINDGFARIYWSSLTIINCDLCDQLGNNLYGIIQINNESNKKRFQWQMVKLCNANNILNQYNIRIEHLPPSSRNRSTFKNELQTHKCIQLTNSAINNINFHGLKCIKNKSRGAIKINKKEIVISQNDLREYVMISVNNNMPLISIVKIKDNNHWIESVLCHIIKENVSFGVSFKCDNNGIMATSIFLDMIDIYNQNKLIGDLILNDVLETFVSGISKMVIR